MVLISLQGLLPEMYVRLTSLPVRAWGAWVVLMIAAILLDGCCVAAWQLSMSAYTHICHCNNKTLENTQCHRDQQQQNALDYR